jgi:hypothetical protein
MKATLVSVSLLSFSAIGSAQTPMEVLKIQNLNKGKWNIVFSSPVVPYKSPFRKMAEPIIQKQEKSVMEHIYVEMKKTHNEPHPGWKVPELYYENTPLLWLETQQVLSLEVTGEHYMGGAHGMTNVRTYNFGMVGGKPARFGIWDALYSHPEAKDNLKYMLLGKAMKDDRCAWIDEGVVTEFSVEQLQRFVVTKTGLRFPFDPYELGPYAAGRIDLEIPFSELKGLIRKNGPLASLSAK